MYYCGYILDNVIVGHLQISPIKRYQNNSIKIRDIKSGNTTLKNQSYRMK